MEIDEEAKDTKTGASACFKVKDFEDEQVEVIRTKLADQRERARAKYETKKEAIEAEITKVKLEKSKNLSAAKLAQDKKKKLHKLQRLENKLDRLEQQFLQEEENQGQEDGVVHEDAQTAFFMDEVAA